jgi:hypothetical protein
VAVGVQHFTVACPKDMTMYADAVKTSGNEENMTVKDIVDFVLEAMDLPEPVVEETASSDSGEEVLTEPQSEELDL